MFEQGNEKAAKLSSYRRNHLLLHKNIDVYSKSKAIDKQDQQGPPNIYGDLFAKR